MRQEDLIIECAQDKPKSGMWHCGPNPCWVTITHKPTMCQARAYHEQQHKAREAALMALELMVGEAVRECSFPEVVD